MAREGSLWKLFRSNTIYDISKKLGAIKILRLNGKHFAFTDKTFYRKIHRPLHRLLTIRP